VVVGMETRAPALEARAVVAEIRSKREDTWAV
jgi:hypothetical protein